MDRHDTAHGARRILVIAGYAPSLVNFRGPLLQAMQATGWEVHAAAPGFAEHDDIREQLAEWGIMAHDIPMQRTGMDPLSDMATLRALHGLMHQLKPDAVLGYTIKPVVYGTLAAALARVPRRFALITGLGYAFTGQANGKRAIVRGLVRRLYAQALGRAHKVFFQNPDDQTLFRQLRLLPERVPSRVVNGSGVDVASFEQAQLPDGPPRFLLIARLLGDKGVREYAEAARQVKSRHPDVIFQLVGWIDDNPDAISQNELDAWVAAGTIEYLGKLSDVRPAIAAASVYVLPSYREGTPRTVLEAMAMGRAVITTDAPGCRETVADGDNGYLVPVQDAKPLAQAMMRFIEQPDLIARMGQRSRERAEEKYDVHKVNAVMLGEMEVT